MGYSALNKLKVYTISVSKKSIGRFRCACIVRKKYKIITVNVRGECRLCVNAHTPNVHYELKRILTTFLYGRAHVCIRIRVHIVM